MAQSIFKGLKSWFVKKPPPDTLVAKWKHEGKLNARPERYVIQAGDTLSGIAERFDVSLNTLKSVNRISRVNTIRVGQVLVIPN